MVSFWIMESCQSGGLSFSPSLVSHPLPRPLSLSLSRSLPPSPSLWTYNRTYYSTNMADMRVNNRFDGGRSTIITVGMVLQCSIRLRCSSQRPLQRPKGLHPHNNECFQNGHLLSGSQTVWISKNNYRFITKYLHLLQNNMKILKPRLRHHSSFHVFSPLSPNLKGWWLWHYQYNLLEEISMPNRLLKTTC